MLLVLYLGLWLVAFALAVAAMFADKQEAGVLSMVLFFVLGVLSFNIETIQCSDACVTVIRTEPVGVAIGFALGIFMLYKTFMAYTHKAFEGPGSYRARF